MTEPWELTLNQARALLDRAELSPLELAESVIDRVQQQDDVIGAFVAFDPAAVLQQAGRATEERHAGLRRGLLHGIPVTLKDLFDWRGLPTTASSRTTGPAPPAAEDSDVARLLRDSGAVLLGKVQTHEFAYGAITPTTRNPADLDRIPGGSSGGSAAAVAAGFGALSVGTDTAGSVRIPAALCGVVGLKPTYGSIGTRGLIPLSWSLDHPGPIGRTVEDVELGFQVLRAPGRPPLVAPDPLDAVVVGVPEEYFFENCAPEVVAACEDVVDRLSERGVRMRPVRLPLAAEAVCVGQEIMSVEAAAQHVATVRDAADLLDPQVRLKLECGMVKPASGYVRALRAREAVKEAWRDGFEGLRAVIAPTTPITAPPVGTSQIRRPDGRSEDLGATLTRFTMPANVVGLPALTVPHGRSGGLPVGVQLIGRPYDERMLLRLGRVIEGSCR